jgi:hypothetical protein
MDRGPIDIDSLVDGLDAMAKFENALAVGMGESLRASLRALMSDRPAFQFKSLLPDDAVVHGSAWMAFRNSLRFIMRNRYLAGLTQRHVAGALLIGTRGPAMSIEWSLTGPTLVFRPNKFFWTTRCEQIVMQQYARFARTLVFSDPTVLSAYTFAAWPADPAADFEALFDAYVCNRTGWINDVIEEHSVTFVKDRLEILASEIKGLTGIEENITERFLSWSST